MTDELNPVTGELWIPKNSRARFLSQEVTILQILTYRNRNWVLGLGLEQPVLSPLSSFLSSYKRQPPLLKKRVKKTPVDSAA